MSRRTTTTFTHLQRLQNIHNMALKVRNSPPNKQTPSLFGRVKETARFAGLRTLCLRCDTQQHLDEQPMEFNRLPTCLITLHHDDNISEKETEQA